MRRLMIWLLILVAIVIGFSQPVDAHPEAPDTMLYLPLVPGSFILGGGQIVGRISDAQTGVPLTGVTACVKGSSNCMVTESDGIYTLDDVPAGINFVQVTPSVTNHSPLTLPVNSLANQSVTLNFSLSSPLKFGEYRIVLTWSPNPYYYALDGSPINNDLDAYLWVPSDPTPYLVYWADIGNCDAFPNACLQFDVQTGNGPETNLILPLDSLGNYHYAVFDYANAVYPAVVPPITNSAARVQIYDMNGLLYTFAVPTYGQGTYWHVFDIDGATAEIIPVNTISWSSPGALTRQLKMP